MNDTNRLNRITIEESGGFAGIKLPGISLSSADLSAAENTAFLKLLQQADLLEAIAQMSYSGVFAVGEAGFVAAADGR